MNLANYVNYANRVNTRNSVNPGNCLNIILIAIISLASCTTARYESYPRATYATASWYGPDFHGRPTSSGEIFDMYALTCAHKEYPFGTELKVTNISNNKTVN
ncbi:MAG: septal ring lytic transglycosylase RlpA family protein, partial [Nitrospirota bacterium]